MAAAAETSRKPGTTSHLLLGVTAGVALKCESSDLLCEVFHKVRNVARKMAAPDFSRKRLPSFAA